MTKQDIIEAFAKNIIFDEEPIAGYHFNIDKISNELLAMFEQEQSESMKIVKITADRTQEFALKEQARDIFERCVYISKEFNHKGVYKRLVDIAKEYGVEL